LLLIIGRPSRLSVFPVAQSFQYLFKIDYGEWLREAEVSCRLNKRIGVWISQISRHKNNAPGKIG